MKRTSLLIVAAAIAQAAASQTVLGQFTFDDALFGNTLQQSDGGAFSFSNWLNTVNTDPGSPAYLTGVGFDTGIANIGTGGNPVYTIGYNNPIFNNGGDDLGIVVGRYSEDQVTMAISRDGQTFGADMVFDSQSAVGTGIHVPYFYAGSGPYDAELFVHSVDLSPFGVGPGESIVAVRITGAPQLDLIRVAGFNVVPEPVTLIGLSLGLLLVARRNRK